MCLQAAYGNDARWLVALATNVGTCGTGTGWTGDLGEARLARFWRQLRPPEAHHACLPLMLLRACCSQLNAMYSPMFRSQPSLTLLYVETFHTSWQP